MVTADVDSREVDADELEEGGGGGGLKAAREGENRLVEGFGANKWRDTRLGKTETEDEV